MQVRSMTTDYRDVHVLVTGVSLPACCAPRAAHCPAGPSSSRLLLAKVARVNSRAGLSYVAWKCMSSSVASSRSNASPRQNPLHSQWIPLRHVSIARPASPDANAALGRGPHDSKFETDNPRVELWSAKDGDMGRFTVARQRIRVGERAFQAASFAVVVRQGLAPRRCHWCFAVLRKKALQCGDCEFARYCSRDCLAADATLHDFQCRALRELKRRGASADVGDLETVRLALAVLSMEQFVRNPHALELLTVHRCHQEGKEEVETRSAVDFIINATDRMIDPKRVRLTLERARCNAHPLYIDGVTCVGTGLFPGAAMALNHSCLPNVTPSFDPRTRTLAFHAIAEIPHGHAVECAYIDLLQTRNRRRCLLARGFGFDCICKRCTHEGKDELGSAGEDENDHDETQVIGQLMQIVNAGGSDARQRLDRLKQSCGHVYQRSDEAQFALYTAEMQLARSHSSWVQVVEAAEMLLKIWTRCGLPEYYHTTETLHLQIWLAAKRAGMVEKAQTSAHRVADIRKQPDTGLKGVERALAIRASNVGGLGCSPVYIYGNDANDVKQQGGERTKMALNSYELVRLGYVVFGGQFLLTFDAWDIIMITAAPHRVHHLWNYRVVLFPLRERDGFAAVGDKPIVCRLDDARLDPIPFWDIAAQPVKC
ncbi:unnamed protein product [Phytophthora lilii]|uniref:Unnamed protein product n=1 Tax=Phytophthora lilii TaxID=2077276 RepID=A0A9W6THW0_9STRA|nr:unnamed protein product [Phytophthora lilii]